MYLDIKGKLAILADAAKYDASCASSGSKVKRGGKGIGVVPRVWAYAIVIRLMVGVSLC